jgi:hypothetical protein
MNNFFRCFLVSALLWESLFCMKATSMEDYRSQRQENGVVRYFSRVFSGLKKTTHQEHNQQEPGSTQIETNMINSTELNYAEEHDKVTLLIQQKYSGGSSLNLNNCNIFSLPPEMRVMKTLQSCVYINLSNNDMSALPDEIMEWGFVSSLNLADNKFTVAPWQVFTIGKQVKSCQTIVVSLYNNPLTRFPVEFFEEMMDQSQKRKEYSGFSIELDQQIIEAYIIPYLYNWPDLKNFLIDSSAGKIINGYCMIQNEMGQFLVFDQDENPYFDYGQG